MNFFHRGPSSIFAGAVVFVALVAFLPALANAATVHEPTTNGLVGYWSFNEGTSTIAHDFSGHGNNGTLSGTTKPSWVSGKLGNGLSFDGSSSYVSGSISGLSVTQISICAWANKSSNPSNYTQVAGDSGNKGAIYVASSGTIFGQFTFVTAGNLNSGGITMPIGWHHFCTTWSTGNPIALYKDGSLVASSANVTDTLQAWSGFWIARYSGGTYFPGSIDEVRIYNRALSQAEITTLYQSGLTKIDTSSVNVGKASSLSTGLVGYWTMDGADTMWTSGTAGVEADKSGNMHSGTLTSMTRALSPVAGKIGQALSFNGSSSYVFPSSLGTPSASISLSVWVKPNAAGGVVMSELGQGTINTSWHDSQVEVETNNTIKVCTWTSVSTCVIAASGIVYGQWYHIVLSYNDSTHILSGYSNGVFGNSVSATRVVPNTGQQYYAIGATDSTNAGDGSYFSGAIDDVRVYGRALSAAEVKQLYLQGGGVAANTSSQNLQKGSSIASGLVGYWTFDGSQMQNTIADSSGQGNNGYFIGAATSSAKVAGKLGQALKFNGSSSYLTFSGSALSSVDSADKTIALWIKPYSVSSYQGLVDKDNGSGGWGVWLNSNHLEFWPYSAGDLVDSGAAVSTNKWLFAVVTWKYGTKTATFYQNGVFSSSQTSASGDSSSGSQPVNIGALRSGQYLYNGIIDDVRVYNRVLSAAEVKSLYNMGK